MQGFTLIEVLIALVIVAISLTAASYAISRNAQNASYIEQKMGAHWVAMNIISREQVNAELPNYSPVVQQNGTTEMLNHTWYWQSKIETLANDEQSYHVTVFVSPTENGSPVEQLDGYIYHIPMDSENTG